MSKSDFDNLINKEMYVLVFLTLKIVNRYFFCLKYQNWRTTVFSDYII